jgi:hypothetical protein
VVEGDAASGFDPTEGARDPIPAEEDPIVARDPIPAEEDPIVARDPIPAEDHWARSSPTSMSIRDTKKSPSPRLSKTCMGAARSNVPGPPVAAVATDPGPGWQDGWKWSATARREKREERREKREARKAFQPRSDPP